LSLGIPFGFTFQRDLKKSQISWSDTQRFQEGAEGRDVKYLQVVLNTDPQTKLTDSGVGSPGNETDYFGSITEDAVRRFEKKYGLSEDGIVDISVRSKLNQILIQNFFAHADYNMHLKFGINPDTNAAPSSYGGYAYIAHPASSRIVYSSFYGAFEVRGAIKAVYESQGSQIGTLGFPVSDEYYDVTTGHQRSDFEGGYIAYDLSIEGYREYIRNNVEVLESSQQVLQSLRTFEYFCGNLYNDGSSILCGTDPIGNCTIGYGHLVHYGPCDGAHPKEQEFLSGITQQRGEQIFQDDVLEKAIVPMRQKIMVPINRYQFDALVHYTYNAGGGDGLDDLLEQSELNEKRYDKVPGTLIITRPTQKGKYLPGLGNRRAKEAFMFAEGKY
jgi:GH24 family phage-related lysozyme (muramidase)/peptidoglycan hydrolase-like protein with peptidoglycan-binding domain